MQLYGTKQSQSFFFVGLIDETKNLTAIADWIFNVDRSLARSCAMQYEISYKR